jgi:hypothetical protein
MTFEDAPSPDFEHPLLLPLSLRELRINELVHNRAIPLDQLTALTSVVLYLSLDKDVSNVTQQLERLPASLRALELSSTDQVVSWSWLPALTALTQLELDGKLHQQSSCSELAQALCNLPVLSALGAAWAI